MQIPKLLELHNYLFHKEFVAIGTDFLPMKIWFDFVAVICLLKIFHVQIILQQKQNAQALTRFWTDEQGAVWFLFCF